LKKLIFSCIILLLNGCVVKSGCVNGDNIKKTDICHTTKKSCYVKRGGVITASCGCDGICLEDEF